MEKVVVPQFVADWFEKNKKGLTIYGLLDLFSDKYFLYDGFGKWVEDYNINEGEAQDVIAKMYLFQDYEIEVEEVEEEKKYYWKRKSEHSLDCEVSYMAFLNYDISEKNVHFNTNVEIGCFKTEFTEKEVLTLLGKQNFDKLEKVEITE